jgi:hypothetical protein
MFFDLLMAKVIERKPRRAPDMLVDIPRNADAAGFG